MCEISSVYLTELFTGSQLKVVVKNYVVQDS